MEYKSITLDTKPGASLHIALLQPLPAHDNPLSNTLVVFLNGLILPSSSWTSAIDELINLRRSANQPLPAILRYDRYGQGRSGPDPTDAKGPYGHDARAAVADLHQLLGQLARDGHLGRRLGLADLRLVLVCSSIGCALARLYAAAHARGRVAALLFLDSMVANTDFVSLFPDPDGPGFGPARLPGGVTPADLRHARAKFREYFHPTVPNPEHLDRRQLGDLLPHADRPALPSGPGGEAPLLTVVGHDWDEFAEQCEQGSLSVSKAVINAYVNTAWARYNEGLTRLVQVEDPGKKPEVKIAKGCGHFIQKDDPAFVAVEINSILDSLSNREDNKA